MLRAGCSTAGPSFLAVRSAPEVLSTRGIAQIPHYEYHIRFSPKEGRKRPSQDVLDRFKRLNNGMWIRAVPAWNKQRYARDDTWLKASLHYETCTKLECTMLDNMMTPFWLRPKHYTDDPYRAYHVRHGLDAEHHPRVNEKGRLTRERPKILLEDKTALEVFRDR